MPFSQALTGIVSHILLSDNIAVGRLLVNIGIAGLISIAICAISMTVFKASVVKCGYPHDGITMFSGMVGISSFVTVISLVCVGTAAMDNFQFDAGFAPTFSQDRAQQNFKNKIQKGHLFHIGMLCHDEGCLFVPSERGISRPISDDPNVRSMEIRPVSNPLSEDELTTYLEGKQPVRLLSVVDKDGHYYGYFSLEKWTDGNKVSMSRNHIIEVNLGSVLSRKLGPINKSSPAGINPAPDYTHVSQDAESNFEASK